MLQLNILKSSRIVIRSYQCWFYSSQHLKLRQYRNALLKRSTVMESMGVRVPPVAPRNRSIIGDYARLIIETIAVRTCSVPPSILVSLMLNSDFGVTLCGRCCPTFVQTEGSEMPVFVVFYRFAWETSAFTPERDSAARAMFWPPDWRCQPIEKL